MRNFKKLSSILVILIVALFAVMSIANQATVEQITVEQIAMGTRGMVTSAHPLATEVGARILAQGGNAIDAAVATAFVLGVVEPYASGLGGEGYIIISLADGTDLAIDFRAKSPGHIPVVETREEARAIRHRLGTNAVATPGTVYAMAMILEKYGTMSLAQVLQPAIRIAREGFPVTETFFKILGRIYVDFFDVPAVADIYFPDGLIPEVGTMLTNPNLAYAMELIAAEGPAAFYTGAIADAIVTATEGWITHEDLARYAAVVREPIRGTYRGYEIIGAPPIVAGVLVQQTLNILENFNLANFGGWDDPLFIHIIAEAMKLADVDRLAFVADPDLMATPVAGLLSKEYAWERFRLIDLDTAVPPAEVPIGDPWAWEPARAAVDDSVYVYAYAGSPATTHISVLDEAGNAVSLSVTISSFWGARVFVPEFGFFLNNQMQNFSTRPESINFLGPNQRPRTVIAPTIVRRDGEIFLIIGTPGGGRIPSTVMLTIINMIDLGMTLEEAIKTPKFASRRAHRELRIEGGYPEETIAALEAMGHVICERGVLDLHFGGVNAIVVLDDGTMVGVGSFRRHGAAAGP